jgi:hypothetical protein
METAMISLYLDSWSSSALPLWTHNGDMATFEMKQNCNGEKIERNPTF